MIGVTGIVSFHGLPGSETGSRPKVFSPQMRHVRSVRRVADQNLKAVDTSLLCLMT